MFVPFNEMPGNSRVWVYMSNRVFSREEQSDISEKLVTFLNEWTAHQQALRASFDIRYDRFIILSVDEAATAASGCSIDKSVGFIRNLESAADCRLMDRLLFGFKETELVKVANKEEFEALAEAGAVKDSTIVFDNLVDTIDALNHRWEIPFERSWHKVLVG